MFTRARECIRLCFFTIIPFLIMERTLWRELATAMLLTSLGSIHTLRLPHLRTAAASLFWSFKLTIVLRSSTKKWQFCGEIQMRFRVPRNFQEAWDRTNLNTNKQSTKQFVWILLFLLLITWFKGTSQLWITSYCAELLLIKRSVNDYCDSIERFHITQTH